MSESRAGIGGVDEAKDLMIVLKKLTKKVNSFLNFQKFLFMSPKHRLMMNVMDSIVSFLIFNDLTLKISVKCVFLHDSLFF